MAHRTANAHHLPVRQVSNAELRSQILGDPSLTDEYAETLSILADDAAMAAIAEGLLDIEGDPTLSELQAGARENGLVLGLVVEEIAANTQTADRAAELNATSITELRKQASKGGLPNAYKGGYTKAQLVDFLLQRGGN